jgi:hypothetical protein
MPCRARKGEKRAMAYTLNNAEAFVVEPQWLSQQKRGFDRKLSSAQF